MHSERVEQQAAAWLARRDGDGWGEADERAFQAWQAQATAHRVAVVRLRTVWAQADRLQALGAGMAGGEVPVRGRWRHAAFPRQPATWGRADVDPADYEARRMAPTAAEIPGEFERPLRRPLAAARSFGRGRTVPERRWRRLALAASAALLIGLPVLVLWRVHGVDRYHTSIGGIQVVPLIDGSRVTLNTDSSIRLDWSTSERRVALERGEAFFEVAADPQRPFVVLVGEERVVAVGTRFSVRRAGGDVQVVVTEGRVRIEGGRGGGTPATLLSAGGVARAGAAGVLVQEADIVRAEERLSWRNGYLAFDDTQLADAVAEFNRYNHRQLVIVDPALAELRIGGNLRASNVDAFVRVLEQGFPIRAVEKDEQILLRSRQ